MSSVVDNCNADDAATLLAEKVLYDTRVLENPQCNEQSVKDAFSTLDNANALADEFRSFLASANNAPMNKQGIINTKREAKLMHQLDHAFKKVKMILGVDEKERGSLLVLFYSAVAQHNHNDKSKAEAAFGVDMKQFENFNETLVSAVKESMVGTSLPRILLPKRKLEPYKAPLYEHSDSESVTSTGQYNDDGCLHCRRLARKAET